jgi:SAM-dependent methyltransferase
VDLFRRTRQWAAGSETVRRWRQRRYEFFIDICAVEPGHRILDVGAGSGGALERFNHTNPIVALDLAGPAAGSWLDSPNVTRVVADAAAGLPYADAEFAVVFCSSVIQYVPAARRAAFAAELQRVGARYFVQTPNRGFPIDPHYQLPFVQFLPRSARRWLSARFTMGWRAKGDPADFEMLNRKELAALFPDGEIHRERLLGLTKSFMIVGGKGVGGPRSG